MLIEFGKIEEKHVEYVTSLVTTTQTWMVTHGLNAQLRQFNEEYLRAIMTGSMDKVLDTVRKWHLVVVPYIEEAKRRHAERQCISVVNVDPAIDVQVVG